MLKTYDRQFFAATETSYFRAKSIFQIFFIFRIFLKLIKIVPMYDAIFLLYPQQFFLSKLFENFRNNGIFSWKLQNVLHSFIKRMNSSIYVNTMYILALCTCIQKFKQIS